MARTPRRRDPTFLHLACFAALGGFGAIAAAVLATVVTWRNGHANTTFLFFSLWGLAALAGAAANVVVYFQSGDPPPKPPRGGQRVTPLRRLDVRQAPAPIEQERKAA
jgi:hypothetical protein